MPVPCAPLLKLFEGPLGAVHLGRLTQGEEAGRFVVLRELGAPQTNLVASEIDRARAMTHPKLVKLLCLGQAEACTYLVSEYVPGVSLTELRSALRQQRTSLPVPVAVRITLDALRAALLAGRLLRSVAGIDAKTPFHPDSIWLAEFGEVLSTPVPREVASDRTPYSSSASDTPPGLLMELATGLSPAKLLGRGLATQLPEPLARALASALSVHARGQGDMEVMLEAALAALPSSLVASEEEVASELERVVGARLQTRRVFLTTDQRGDARLAEHEATLLAGANTYELTPAGDEPTRVFQGPRAREADPDGATELLSSPPPHLEAAPAPLAIPRFPSAPPPIWAAAFLQTPHTPTPKPPGVQAAPPRANRTPLLLAALITAAAVAAAVIAYLER